MGSKLQVLLTGFCCLAAMPILAARDCPNLTAPAGVTLTERTLVEASEQIAVAHCLVRGRLAERTGKDGEPYAISFELRLPSNWSGRFLHQFNGGNDGNVVPALGARSELPREDNALVRGFAVVSSDAGHNGAAHPEAGFAGGNLFGFDFEARRDYGYGAVAKLQPVAIALTETYYGESVKYRYAAGSSNGGRHALVAASRMPNEFDGILAGYPGFNLPRAALQHAWDIQQFKPLASTIANAFSKEEMAIVGAAVTASCDALDGLADGLVFATMACQQKFTPATLVCNNSNTGACLPQAKVDALVKILGGPRNSKGEMLYASWPWDNGLASNNWRVWRIEDTAPPMQSMPRSVVLGSGSLAQVFTTPPTKVSGDPASLQAFLLGFDWDTGAPRINATNVEFPESPMQVMAPPDGDNPVLQTFSAAGGKLMVFHGVSDPAFSFLDTVQWFERLQANNSRTQEFVRFYAVPGMPHGPGGPAPDRFDMLTALVEWVEQGKAPGAIEARVRNDNQEAPAELRGAIRPLCPWPAVTTSVDRSTSRFTCVTE